MSDNRKYITSTGLLLKSLNQEPMQSLAPPPPLPPLQQQHPSQTIHHHYPPHPHPHHHQQQQQHHPPPQPPQHINAYTTASHYPHQPQPQSYLLQHPSNFTNLSNIGGAPPTNTVSSYLSQDLINRFPKKQTQQPPPPQQQQQQNVNKQIPKRPSTHQLQQQQQPSSSTVSELPETFGLPSDFLAKSKSKGLQHIPKYTTSSSSLTTANVASSSTNLEQLAYKKLNEQQQQQNSSLTESSSAPSLAVPTSIETSNKKDTDIEIISEHYPTRPRQIQTNLQAKQPTDEEYKQYLKNAYNLDSLLTLSTKPQCNFVSNLACIDQLLTQCKYDEKKKPFTVLKRVYNQINEDLESLSQDELNVCRKSDRTIKKQKVIVINDEENGEDGDGKDEAHKPWITPQLLQLIKQRNLLQSKLNQQEEGGGDGEMKTITQPDPELLQKFKNLRNKVTKLVKNARKEYLVKIIKEKKEKEATQAGTASTTSVTGGVTTTTTTTTAADGTTSTTVQTTPGASLQSTLLTLSQQHPITQTHIQQALSSTHSSMMMNFYNSFFNQYMQQYTQQKIQKPPDTGDSEKDNYEYLKQQASYYAQQQHNVQSQLESCLSSTIQQFMNELSSQASATTATSTTITPSTSSIAATTTTTAATITASKQLPFNPTYHYNTST